MAEKSAPPDQAADQAQQPAAEASAPPAPASAAAVDAAVAGVGARPAFDPSGVYVVMAGSISLPRGPMGEWREPAFYGDLVAAEDGDGVIGLRVHEQTAKKTSTVKRQLPDGTTVQELQEIEEVTLQGVGGAQRLEELYNQPHTVRPNGDVTIYALEAPTHPEAVAARRGRLAALAAQGRG